MGVYLVNQTGQGTSSDPYRPALPDGIELWQSWVDDSGQCLVAVSGDNDDAVMRGAGYSELPPAEVESECDARGVPTEAADPAQDPSD